jgi:hypothetical protein
MKEYKGNMFIVINKKHIKKLEKSLQEYLNDQLVNILYYLPDNDYYVCNQDEPYSDKVIETILYEGKNIEKLKSDNKKLLETLIDSVKNPVKFSWHTSNIIKLIEESTGKKWDDIK